MHETKLPNILKIKINRVRPFHSTEMTHPFAVENERSPEEYLFGG